MVLLSSVSEGEHNEPMTGREKLLIMSQQQNLLRAGEVQLLAQFSLLVPTCWLCVHLSSAAYLNK